MGSKIKVGVLFALAAFNLFAGVSLLTSTPDDKSEIKNAVYVEDAKVDPANDGKVVIVPGKLTYDSPLVDAAVGVKLNTIKGRRGVQQLTKVKDSDDPYGYVFKWKSLNIKSYEAPFYGINDDRTISSYLVADNVKIGDLEVDAPVLNPLPSGDQVSKYTEDMYAGTALHPEYNSEIRCEYLSSSYGIPNDDPDHSWAKYEGVKRYNYTIRDPKDSLKVTLLARQKGGKLYVAEGIDALSLYEGILTKKEVLKKNASDPQGGAAICIVIGLVFGLLGVRALRKKN